MAGTRSSRPLLDTPVANILPRRFRSRFAAVAPTDAVLPQSPRLALRIERILFAQNAASRGNGDKVTRGSRS
jgi:hypothetical protein